MSRLLTSLKKKTLKKCNKNVHYSNIDLISCFSLTSGVALLTLLRTPGSVGYISTAVFWERGVL